MKAISAHTLELDPYRAGVELADALKVIEPEVVLLFSTIYYGDSPELTEALYDVLGPKLVVIGATGDGFFEKHRTADVGASAVGLNAGGRVRWHVSSAEGLTQDSAGVATRCLTNLREALGPGGPDLVILFADFHGDGSAIEAAIHRTLKVPVVGGFAADNNMKMERCFTYANRAVLKDGIVALGIKGAIQFDIHVAQDLRPVGRTGLVTEAGRTRLVAVDEVGAMAFIEREIGRPVTTVDQGIVTLNVLDHGVPAKKYLRSIVPDSAADDGGLSLFGGIPTGKRVQVCLAHPDDIIAEVYRVAALVNATSFEPVAALVVSCAGRKHLLGNRIEHESRAVVEARGSLALAGFPSFGEIGPVKVEGAFSETFFHNMTYILLLIGGA